MSVSIAWWRFAKFYPNQIISFGDWLTNFLKEIILILIEIVEHFLFAIRNYLISSINYPKEFRQILAKSNYFVWWFVNQYSEGNNPGFDWNCGKHFIFSVIFPSTTHPPSFLYYAIFTKENIWVFPSSLDKITLFLIKIVETIRFY